MALHEQVRALREQRLADGCVPIYMLSVDEARAADLAEVKQAGSSPEPVEQVFNFLIPGVAGRIPIRVYLPRSAGGPHPVLMYFFGGGWVLGTLETSDRVCRALTNATGCATVAVGYRLAPEHRFPAAIDDCYAALRWIADFGVVIGLDMDRIAVAGDSAGGNLAAASTLRSRDEGGPKLAAQVLIYPNTDRFSDTPSMHDNTDPAFFNNRSVEWYWNHYLSSPVDADSPLVSPLRASDLSGLPPALIITAEHDPLRDQGEQYAARLQRAAVDVELTRYNGMIHGFFTMTGILDDARAATNQVAQFIRRRLTDRG
ncbi:alpha/beta hydrolase [Micromonospora sp. NPDC094482]|uniref:alpha/beta hydrolase n=1 Tax=unclassified Micromonospora TaxID=2617518 RepID=UPI00332CC083